MLSVAVPYPPPPPFPPIAPSPSPGSTPGVFQDVEKHTHAGGASVVHSLSWASLSFLPFLGLPVLMAGMCVHTRVCGC